MLCAEHYSESENCFWVKSIPGWTEKVPSLYRRRAGGPPVIMAISTCIISYPGAWGNEVKYAVLLAFGWYVLTSPLSPLQPETLVIILK